MQGFETPTESALATGRGISVHGAGAGDLVEDAADFAILGLGGLDVLGLKGGEERLDLILDLGLAPAAEGSSFDVLADAFLGGKTVGHYVILFAGE